MPFQHSRILHPGEMAAKARALVAHPTPAVRAARLRVARVGRAVARSPQSLFLRELVVRPAAMGAICASSPRLAACMAAWVDPRAEGWVVELGAGTGVITRALLRRGVSPERLIVLERSPRLADHLRQHFPEVQVLQGDAADLPALLGDAAPAGLPVQHVVSGLPLLSIAEPARTAILQAGAAALAPGGRLLQFTYALHGDSPWLRAGLKCLQRERVLANLPPARIDVLGKPAY